VYGQQKGTADDLKAVSQAMLYLQEHDLSTLEDLDAALLDVRTRAKEFSAAMKKAEKRMQLISGIQDAVNDCRAHQAVHDRYIRIGWKTRQAAFAEAHKDELDSYNKAYRYLKKHGADLNVDLKALEKEYDSLKALHARKSTELAAVKEELQPMKEIRFWIGKVLSREESVIAKEPEPKHSIKEHMRFLQEHNQQTPEQKTPNMKKQNREH